MGDVKPVRFILRAEIRDETTAVVSYAVDLTPTTILVVTDWQAPVGTPIGLRLSFPGVLEPVDIDARVDDLEPPGGPGELGGVRLAFSGGRGVDVARSRLSRLSYELNRWSTLDADRTYRVLLVE